MPTTVIEDESRSAARTVMKQVRAIRSVPVFIAAAALLAVLALGGCIKPDERSADGQHDRQQAREYARKAQQEYEQAIRSYRQFIAAHPDDGSATIELARLYFDHGSFKDAAQTLEKSSAPEAVKIRALSQYRLGNYAEALAVFTKNDLTDSEYRYYHGLTCEKLNLFDRALEAYRSITDGGYGQRAKERINAIVRQEGLLGLSDLSAEVQQLIASAPAAESYPQAGALVLMADESASVSAENTLLSTYSYVIKILNDRGKEEFSEAHVEYDSTFEKVELEYARTIRPDGAVIEVGERHLRDVSKYLNFPLYSNVRVFIISFPEVTQGAVLEYKLRVTRSELINKKEIVTSYPVQSSEPIINARFALEIPSERTLRFKYLNEGFNTFGAHLAPAVSTEQGRTRYRWEFRAIPQIMPEANMPPLVEVNPTILISSFDSWDAIWGWWWELAREKLAVNDPIRQTVKELTRGKTTDEEKAAAIFQFCSRQIRYVAVEYGQGGYEPHACADIFSNKYGDCKDKAILLVAMLRVAGLKAYPVLIATKESYNLNPDFFSVLFDHAVASVEVGQSLVFMDPTAETCAFGDLPPGDQDRRVLVIRDEGYRIMSTPRFPAAHNLLRNALTIQIGEDEGMQAHKRIDAFGIYGQAQRYWFLYTPPEQIEEAIKERIQAVSIGARLKGYTIDNADDPAKPAVLTYDFSGPEYCTVAGKLRLAPQLTDLDTSLVARDERTYDIDLGILDTKETDTTIAIPRSFVVRYVPETVEVDNQWFHLAVAYSVRGNEVSFTQRLETKQTLVAQKEYPVFKRMYEELAKRLKQRMVLEKVR